MQTFDPTKWIVDESDFIPDPSMKNKRSSGGCGIVTFWIQKSTNKKCAKKITQSKLTKAETRKRFDVEIKILGSYSHPAIVPFVGYNEVVIKKSKKGNIYLQTIEKGSLFENIIKNNKEDNKDPLWDDTHKLIIAYGIAAAMEYLHSFKVLHRDLKPLNVLLDKELRPYVTDFDASKEVNPLLSIHQSITTTTACIMSPEFYEDALNHKDKPYIDVYAYGMTIYHLITGLQPFENLQPMMIYEMVSKGERPIIPDYIPDCWKNLIEQSWSQAPIDRPSFTEILNLLESPEFNNNTIDQQLYNNYIQLLKPNRPASTTTTSVLKESISPAKPTKSSIPSPEKSPLDKLRFEATQGNFATELELAKALFSGTFGPPDYLDASKHFVSVVNKSGDQKLVLEAENGVVACYTKLRRFEEARRYLLKHGIYHGNAEASFQLAEMIRNGEVKSQHPGEMQRLYERAARAGHPEAICKYARMCELGSFGPASLEEANKYFRIGSDKGIPEMMYRWSIQLEFGRGVEKDVAAAMSLLLGAANLGCLDAQYDYAVHLMGGRNVEEDAALATSLFKSLAEKGNASAMLWYYLLQQCADNVDETDKKLAEELFEKSLQKREEPESFAIKGQMLHQKKKINEAIEYLSLAMKSGSLLAHLELGEICEESPDIGDASAFFRHAALRCHFHGSQGFAPPILAKVFHCNDCGLDVCEGCAKHCHAGHNIRDVDERVGFVCDCEKKGDIEKLCSVRCFGEAVMFQHAFQCADCAPNNDQCFMCRSCAEKCHKGHNVIDYGLQRVVCACGGKSRCKCTGLE